MMKDTIFAAVITDWETISWCIWRCAQGQQLYGNRKEPITTCCHKVRSTLLSKYHCMLPVATLSVRKYGSISFGWKAPSDKNSFYQHLHTHISSHCVPTASDVNELQGLPYDDILHAPPHCALSLEETLKVSLSMYAFLSQPMGVWGGQVGGAGVMV